MSQDPLKVDVVFTQSHGGTSRYGAKGGESELANWLRTLANDIDPKAAIASKPKETS